MKTILTVLFCTIGLAAIHSQKQIDLKVSLDASASQSSCYDIAVKTTNNTKISLAGQNYRLFYDADKLNFLKEKSYSLLDPRSYSGMDILNTETQGIGFLSLSIAGRKITDKTLVLRNKEEWVETIKVCFEHETDKPFDLTWAHNGKTATFATAEVAMSEWVDKDHHQVLDVNLMEDYRSIEASTESLVDQIELKVYPNPLLDYVNIEIDDSLEPEVLIIRDIIGREVVYDNIRGRTQVSYDLLNWPDGSYTIDVLDEDSRRLFSQKVTKTGR